jgi:CheY-like chemotaxis protein
MMYRQVLCIADDQPAWRILVVDDNPDNRLVIRTPLERVGFEVEEAVNGQDAIVQWQTWQPYLIWMDMRMPVMDGYEATRQIRELERKGQGQGSKVQGGHGNGRGEPGAGSRKQAMKNESPPPSTHLPIHSSHPHHRPDC